MKMIKNLGLMIIAIMLCSQAWASEKVDVKWGKSTASKTFTVDIIGEDENSVFCLGVNREELYIERYNRTDKKLNFSKKIIIPRYKGIDLGFERIFLFEENLLVMASGFNKTTKCAVTYAFKMSKDGVLNKKPLQVAEVPVEKKRRSGSFGFDMSNDGQRILVHHSAMYNKEDVFRISARVITPELECIKELKKEFPYAEDFYSIEAFNFALNNKDEIFFIVNKVGHDKQEFNLVSFTGENSKFHSTPIEIEASAVTSATIDFDTQENVVIAGFYTDSYKSFLAKTDALVGVFYMSYDTESNEISELRQSRFTKKLMLNYMKEKQYLKGRGLPLNLVPRDIIMRSDGGVVILSEFYMHMISEANGWRQETHHFGDVIAVSINSEGIIDWNIRVPKYQMSVQRSMLLAAGFSGIFIGAYVNMSKDKSIYYGFLNAVVDDKIFLIFNDDPRNGSVAEDGKSRPLMNPKNGVPCLVEIDGEGNVSKSLLFNAQSSSVYLRPQISNQVGDDRIIIYGSQKKIDKLGEIIFHE